MNFFEKCKNLSVIVDDGSGVLFQPMTEEYTYVLTAKHNIEIEENGQKVLKNIVDIEIKKYDGNILTVRSIYPHDDLDIAIIKIDKINIESPLKYLDNPSNDERYNLYGYPETRRNDIEKILNYVLEVTDVRDSIITARNIDYSQQSEVNGFSGGGVFKDGGDTMYLIGIECEMHAISTRETHERVNLVHINAFDKIVEQHSNILTPLLPPFMDNFASLLEKTFSLNNMIYNRDTIRSKLQSIAQTKIISNIKPLDITSEQKDVLLIDGQNTSEYTNELLWKMYLEFLIACQIIDAPESLDLVMLNELKKKRIFLFGKARTWIGLTEQILRSNLSMLESGGIVFVGCDGDSEPVKCELTQKALRKISSVPPELMNIASGVQPYDEIRIKHIHALESQIISNEEVFEDADIINVEEKIKNEFSTVVSR